MDALGMLEVNSIARGMEVGDAMLKAAEVELVTAMCVCAGKYIVMVRGDVAAVTSSVEVGRELAQQSEVDSIIIPNVHEMVFAAINSASVVDEVDAVGVVETFSLASCVISADYAVKAAAVELIEIRLGRGMGGKSFYVLTGDVSAVRSAVESGVGAISGDGMVTQQVVIPSPHRDLVQALL